MTQVIVEATAVRRLSHDDAGWIEVEVVDAAGRAHRVVTRAREGANGSITAESSVPSRPGLLAEYVRMEAGTVVIRFADDAATTEGVDEVRMDVDLVHWL